MTALVWRLLWFIFGALFIGCGIYLVLNPDIHSFTFSYIAGVVISILGAINIFVFIVMRKSMYSVKWTLVEGAVTLLFGITILINPWATASILPYIISIWALFTGISCVIGSRELHEANMRGAVLFTIIGIIEILLAFASFFDPVTAIISLSILGGIFFILQGITTLFKGVFAN